MEYTIKKLGLLASVSTRTLRYYDEISLLKPVRINSSGYRIYGENEVNRLQQILFYRELGVSLDEIKDLMNAEDFNADRALKEHREKLIEKRKQLDLLIANVEQTLAQRNGAGMMSDEQKFEGFKQKLIDDNEKKFGSEIRARYGEEEVEKSNHKLKGLTEKQYKEMEQLSTDIQSVLAQALATKDPAGELAQKAAHLHRQWLAFSWGSYSKEAHAQLAQMYVEDERFRAYYEQDLPGAAQFLRDAIVIYTSKLP